MEASDARSAGAAAEMIHLALLFLLSTLTPTLDGAVYFTQTRYHISSRAHGVTLQLAERVRGDEGASSCNVKGDPVDVTLRLPNVFIVPGSSTASHRLEIEVVCKSPDIISRHLHENTSRAYISITPHPTACSLPFKELFVEEGAQRLKLADLRGTSITSIKSLMIDYASHFLFDSTLGALWLEKPLDREKVESVELKVFCLGKSNLTANIMVNVMDIDDNPIHSISQSDPCTTECHYVITKEFPIEANSWLHKLIVFDKDLPISNNHSVHLLDGSASLILLTKFGHLHYFSYSANLMARVDLMQPLKFKINVTDRTLYNNTASQSMIVSYSILNSTIAKPCRFKEPVQQLQEETSVLTSEPDHHISMGISLSRKASLYARLDIPREISQNLTHFASQPHNFLNVTPHTGIIYVSDVIDTSTQLDPSPFVLMTSRKNYTLRIHLTGEPRKLNSSKQESCSIHNNEEQCLASSSIGTKLGYCRWRTGPDHKTSSKYSTCLSDNPCGDNFCDEIESLFPEICPQDCAQIVYHPDGKQSNGTKECGLGSWLGVCTCCKQGRCSACNCFPLIRHGKLFRKVVQPGEEPSACSIVCRWIVGIVIAVVVGISSLLVYISLRRAQLRALKHVSIISVAQPSEYSRPQTDFTLQPIFNSPQERPTIVVEPEWSIPRSHIRLGAMLGEGEFGCVYKSEIMDHHGHWIPGAVKMVKPDAGIIEVRDLVSELDLLKQVRHKNVIRLMGACVDNAKLFIVVEYCAHGSLKAFLRSHRFAKEIISSKQLLSFAWQIAEGMTYLSKMKLIHRDLAARNILVTQELRIKISDFGLSRDIYVSEAYFRKSKCRLPFKWMAPECLYDNIYTTHSDVWSFGIVLWEIVTRGASPYPGVTADSLFQLLKTGYVMPAPPECSQTLYRVMKSCWNIKEDERPTFLSLSLKLEQMLLQETDYIDISPQDSLIDSEYAAIRPTQNNKLQMRGPSREMKYVSVCGENGDEDECSDAADLCEAAVSPPMNCQKQDLDDADTQVTVSFCPGSPNPYGAVPSDLKSHLPHAKLMRKKLNSEYYLMNLRHHDSAPQMECDSILAPSSQDKIKCDLETIRCHNNLVPEKATITPVQNFGIISESGLLEDLENAGGKDEVNDEGEALQLSSMQRGIKKKKRVSFSDLPSQLSASDLFQAD